MNDVVVDANLAVVTSRPTQAGFSWGAVIAGATVTSVTILFLLSLGAGIGLSLTTAQEAASASSGTGATIINAGSLYFFFSETFGAAVGGYLAGRLIGPMWETSSEEIFRSSTHGLVTWTFAVLMTAILAGMSGLALAGPGINAAAILGANQTQSQQSSNTEDTGNYWVDRLFRPSTTGAAQPTENPSPTPGTTASATSAPLLPTTPMRAIDPQTKSEAGRILAMGLLRGRELSDTDHEQLVRLISQGAGIDAMEARNRVDEVQTQIRTGVEEAAEAARVAARYVSLWLSATLLVGAFAAALSGVTGRHVDDKARNVGGVPTAR